MSYNKIQAGRECSAFIHSEGGKALGELNKKDEDSLLSRILNMDVGLILANPSEIAGLVAEYKALQKYKSRMTRIIEEAARTNE